MFDLPKDIDVYGLKQITQTFLLSLFYKVMGEIKQGLKPKPNGKEWGEYYSRQDFQEFCQITAFNDEATERKLRATYYPNAPDGPYILMNDKKWRLIPDGET
jgi:hypothetical protein